MNTGTNLVKMLPDDAIQMSSSDVLWLSVLATGGLVLLWGIFWVAVHRRQESITTILSAPTFFRILRGDLPTFPPAANADPHPQPLPPRHQTDAASITLAGPTPQGPQP